MLLCAYELFILFCSGDIALWSCGAGIGPPLLLFLLYGAGGLRVGPPLLLFLLYDAGGLKPVGRLILRGFGAKFTVVGWPICSGPKSTYHDRPGGHC